MFAETRRMKRIPAKLFDMHRNGEGNTRCFELMDTLNIALDKYCGTGDFGQDRDPSIADYNSPPEGQPGLWCQWVPSEDGTEIVWNGAEKFYYYVEWIDFLVEKFLKPWGYKVNGRVEWSGEEQGDIGVIEVIDNVVDAYNGETGHTLDRERAKSAPVSNTDNSEIILDLVKLRNELQSSKKGTSVAVKKIDVLIKKYGI